MDKVLFFDVADDEILGRIEKRRGIEGRTDDDPEAVTRRLAAYREQTAPVLAWYEGGRCGGRFRRSGSVEEIAERVQRGAGGPGAHDHTEVSEGDRDHGPGGRIVADTLELVRERSAPGMSTEELDAAAEKFIRSHPGAAPSFKGLYGFPKTLCVSINEEIVHGIPSTKRVLPRAAS